MAAALVIGRRNVAKFKATLKAEDGYYASLCELFRLCKLIEV
jgi:hypothetical protein